MSKGKWTDEAGRWVEPSERVSGVFGIWRMAGLEGFNPSVEVAVRRSIYRGSPLRVDAYVASDGLTSEQARQLARVLWDAANALDAMNKED